MFTSRRVALLAAAAAAILLPARSLLAQADSARAPVTFRVVGVFDEQTGEPIEGADITDMITGTTVRTTATGTAPVYFTNNTGTLVKIKKLGYRQSVVPVASPRSQPAPLTTTLLRAGQALPRVITVGNRVIKLGKADTIPELLRSGFYVRRETSAAPVTAFVTGDKISATLLTSNVRYFGRALCESNLYVDGMLISVPPRTGHFLKEGIDAIVDPFDVAGIETYELGESPSSGAHTATGDIQFDPSNPRTNSGETSGNGSVNAAGTLTNIGCLTLIWLKH